MMKKLLSTRISNGAFNAAMLLLRITIGGLMIHHGYDKLVHFATKKNEMINFLGIGQSMSLALVIFAEFFCALFIILGLFTRLASIPLIITMAVALFQIHKGDAFGNGETCAIYLGCYITLLIAGPGKVSVDGMIGK